MTRCNTFWFRNRSQVFKSDLDKFINKPFLFFKKLMFLFTMCFRFTVIIRFEFNVLQLKQKELHFIHGFKFTLAALGIIGVDLKH